MTPYLSKASKGEKMVRVFIQTPANYYVFLSSHFLGLQSRWVTCSVISAKHKYDLNSGILKLVLFMALESTLI